MRRLTRIEIGFFLIVAVYMALGITRSIGIYRIIPMEVTIALLVVGGLITLFWSQKDTLDRKQVLLFLALASLTPYSLLTSRHQNLSLLIAFFPLASCLLYISLSNLNHEQSAGATSDQARPAINASKYAVIVCGSIHAVAQVFFYLFTPIRTTGLMDDFSQSSMLLLVAYGMAVPSLKAKPVFTAFSLVFFVAFFASFSRTANFLLLFFFLGLFIIAVRTKDYRTLIKISVTCVLALLFVYIYPSVLGQDSVDRGGLSHLSTLNSRTIYWQTAWEAIQQRPFLGHGIGTYSYTGINEAQPFNKILYVHNDYLQIWHDLGILWLTAFVGGFGYLLLKHSPLRYTKSPWKLSCWQLDTEDEGRFLSWILLVSIVMYMGINFLITNIEFQVAIAILSAELSRK